MAAEPLSVFSFATTKAPRKRRTQKAETTDYTDDTDIFLPQPATSSVESRTRRTQKKFTIHYRVMVKRTISIALAAFGFSLAGCTAASPPTAPQGAAATQTFALYDYFNSQQWNYSSILLPPNIYNNQQLLDAADQFLNDQPLTITAFHAVRSAGGVHEYFSEGLYWWPDPKNPDGPYIRRDGYADPDNFNGHYDAMIKMSNEVSTLTAAFMMTGDKKYADKAIEHLQAWFVNPDTMMAPNLEYAQAIEGINTGRGTGIIESMQMVKVARCAKILEDNSVLVGSDARAVNQWFADYIHWLITSPHGQDEMNAKNNHGTFWVLQVAAYAQLNNDQKTLAFCRARFKNVLLHQMAADGSFPLELARTKPYGYSLLDLNAMSLLCWILSTRQDNLWNYSTSDGRSMRKALAFLYPFIADKSSWPHKPDVEHWLDQPGCPPALLFGGLACHVPAYVELWEKLYPQSNQDNHWLIGQAGIWLGEPVKW
jgi:Alginate lyase